MQEVRFISSLFTFYVKGKISVDRDFVRIKKPKQLLGFIPAGFEIWSVPIDQISEVCTYCMGFLDYLKRVAIILFFTIVALALLPTMPLISLAMVVVGGSVIANSFFTGLCIDTIGTKEFHMFCPKVESKKMENIESEIDKMMRLRRTDTNVRLQNNTLITAQAANTQAIINAINSNKNN